ncbi:MAG: insulinase family protein [Candidatus Moduliflexus flocculans]|nr:insulinase family protein [Candidatus Moduliflexus flocculans]
MSGNITARRTPSSAAPATSILKRSSGSSTITWRSPAGARSRGLSAPPSFVSQVAVYPKDLSEIHFCCGVEGLPHASEERHCLCAPQLHSRVKCQFRLFQEIREKKGYAYSIYSFVSSYVDTGYWTVYAGTGKKRAKTVIEMIVREMRGLADTMTDEELKRAKDQLKGNIILGLESTSNRMQSIARQEIYYGRYFSQKEIMREIDAVSMEQMRDLAHRLVNAGKMSVKSPSTVLWTRGSSRGLLDANPH